LFKHNNLKILFSTNIVVYALTFCFYLRYIESNVLISLWHWLVVWRATSNTIITMVFNHVGQIRKYSSLCQKKSSYKRRMHWCKWRHIFVSVWNVWCWEVKKKRESFLRMSRSNFISTFWYCLCDKKYGLICIQNAI